MNSLPPHGLARVPASRAYRMKRDGYVWVAKSGRHREVPRGTLLSGLLLRRNEVFQKLIIETDEGVINVNEEDVEALGSN